MKTRSFLDIAPSTTMKLSYLPVSPIWTSFMIKEQSPDSSFSSGTSSRPMNFPATATSFPRCSNTVLGGATHWIWQAEGATSPKPDFQLQGSTTCFPTVDVMDFVRVAEDREEDSERRKEYQEMWPYIAVILSIIIFVKKQKNTFCQAETTEPLNICYFD